ncbi:hypothetical protein QD357_10555 [Rhizobium sp. BR 317]|uniref:hypothetical protein n=1 Tax=Rhizobium sp. BR 317 TaxID=3040015 RepID=UPI0039BFECC6
MSIVGDCRVLRLRPTVQLQKTTSDKLFNGRKSDRNGREFGLLYHLLYHIFRMLYHILSRLCESDKRVYSSGWRSLLRIAAAFGGVFVPPDGRAKAMWYIDLYHIAPVGP